MSTRATTTTSLRVGTSRIMEDQTPLTSTTIMIIVKAIEAIPLRIIDR